MRQPSIKDVAKQAGVTIGTVSRAFNGYDDINPETKRRILSAASELGYVPNRSARNLSSKRNRNIALVLSDYAAESPLSETAGLLTKGACCYAHERGMELVSYFITPAMQAEKTYDQFCSEHSLSGALLFGIRLNEPWNNLQNASVPCVTVDVEIDRPHVGSILTDDRAAFEEMCDLLIDQGHRNIAIVYGRVSSMVSEKRWEGASRSFQKHGITINEDWVIHSDFMKDVAYEETRRFLQTHSGEVTAFLCMSDVIAFAVIQAITGLGYSVPGDYSVTGYDGFSIGQYATPAITTIDQDFVRKGYAGASLLNDMLEDPSVSRKVLVPYRLLHRSSTAPPKQLGPPE